MYDRSRALFERSQQVIPGGVNSPVRAFRAVGGTPVFFREGRGAWTISGRRKPEHCWRTSPITRPGVRSPGSWCWSGSGRRTVSTPRATS